MPDITAALARFNEVFGTGEAANAYARRMDCEDVAALVALLRGDRAREAWLEAHGEDCEGGCRDDD